MFFLSFSILVVLLGAPLFVGRFFVNRNVNMRMDANDAHMINDARIYKYFFATAIILIFVFCGIQSYWQYEIWAGNDFSEHLLPPYQSADYFIFYVFTRFFAPYLISLAAGLIFLFSAKILNKKYEERFFYSEEIYLGSAAIFLSGHPGWLFYVIFLLSIYVLIQLFFVAKYSILNTQYPSPRISLYWLWIPVAIFVIIIMNWLQSLEWWSLLKI